MRGLSFYVTLTEENNYKERNITKNKKGFP